MLENWKLYCRRLEASNPMSNAKSAAMFGLDWLMEILLAFLQRVISLNLVYHPQRHFSVLSFSFLRKGSNGRNERKFFHTLLSSDSEENPSP